MHSENGIGGCRILSIIAHRAKPARASLLFPATGIRHSFAACYSVAFRFLEFSRTATKRLRIDFGSTGCTNAG
jgi:hypothetical protein